MIPCAELHSAKKAAISGLFVAQSDASGATSVPRPDPLSPQRQQQFTQSVVVNLLHQLQQATDFTLGKPLTGKPVEVVAR